MYTIPAQRTTDARRAMTDLRVVVAGPIGAVPESRMSRRGGYSVGRMHQMIGPGRPAIFLIGRTETYEPNGWAARPGRALSNSGHKPGAVREPAVASAVPAAGNPVQLGLKPRRAAGKARTVFVS